MKSLFPDYYQFLGNVMDVRSRRQNVVASNLANINTPGYKAKRLEFEEELQNSLQMSGNGGMTRTNAKHMPTGIDPQDAQGAMRTDIDPRMVQGEDNVDLDKEMSIMSKNGLAYKTLSQVLHSSFTGMEEIIRKGGK